MSRARYSLIPSAAVRDKDLTELQFRCLCMIGTYLGEDQSAFPSQSTLAEDLGVTREAVNKAIKVLREKGYIKATNRYRGDGGQTSSLYQVVLDLPATPCDPEFTPPVNAKEHTPCERIGSHQEDTQSKIPKGTDSSDRVPLPPIVEQIWSETPEPSRKRSSKKLLAENLKRAVQRGVNPKDLLQALRACVSDPQMIRDGHKYMPAIHRWIRDERYIAFLPKDGDLLDSAKDRPPTDAELLDQWFGIFAAGNGWRGRHYGFLLEPDDPEADYPEALYAKHGLKKPERV